MTSADPNWGQEVTPLPSVHTPPAEVPGAQLPDQTQIIAWGKNLIEGILKEVVLSIIGVLLPGPAGEQLSAWASGLIDSIGGIIEEIAAAITGLSGGASSNPLDQLSQFFEDFLGALGLGGSGLGTGGTGGTTPPDGNGGGTVTPGTFNPDTAMKMLLEKLVGAGALTSNTPIPANLLTALTPGTSNNLLPDASFANQTSVAGQGLWVYDWPGKGSTTWGTSGCVRTKRTETITIYWCGGTWEQSPGANLWAWPDPASYLKHLSSVNTVNDAGTFEVVGENLLDWTHFDVINVPYPGALYPMGGSLAEGARSVIDLINKTPGKFILMGLSQGAGVMSMVYDEIRHGSLTARDADLLNGFVFGNIRRQKDRRFPGGPDYTPAGGWGVYPTTLTDTEDRWWEWALEAGTYPAYDEIDGITFTTGDPYAALGNTTPAETGLRDLVAQTAAAQTYDAITFYTILITATLSNPGFALVTAANTLLGTPHAESHYLVQPFLSTGDHRTYFEIVMDEINSHADEVTPPLVGARHQLEGVQVAVQPLQVVVGKASVQWVNVVSEGPSILVGINAYGPDTKDAFGNTIPGPLITGLDHPTISVIATDATISDPDSASGGWVDLEASFVMPPGAATARLVFDVEPDAMTTGTVWFDEGRLEVSSLIDASLLANIQNIPTLPGSSVQGPQGIADMLTAYQNLIDGATAAATQQDMTGSGLGALFEAQGQVALNASSALELSISQQQQLANNSVQPLSNGLQPTGEATFSLATAPLSTVTVASGHTLAGFINCAQAARKGFIEILARCSGTGVYLNVYTVDPVTGDWTDRLWSSGDISASISSTMDWISVTLPGVSEINVSASMLVALEVVAQGTSVDLVGSKVVINDGGSPLNLPNHPSSVFTNYGASRATASTGGVSPSTVSSSALTFGNTEPFVVFGVANVPPDYQPDTRWSEKTPGTHTFAIPSYIQAGDRIDVALNGAGAGGELAGFGAVGFGGEAGKWVLATLVYGTNIPLTTTSLTVTVGAGGAAGADGTATTLSGTGVTTLTAAGGRTAKSANEKGQGSPDQTWEGRRYFGGQEVAAGQSGAKPGGGGGGGSAGLFGLLGVMPVGAGADGSGWLTVKQL
jgi:hypothetical protein